MTPPAVFQALLAGSLAAGLLICLVFRWCANAEKLRRARDEMIAHMLGVRLYRDQVRVALRCYAQMAGAAGRYLWLMIPAVAVLALPMYWLYGEMARRLDHVAPLPGEAVLLNARFRSAAALDGARLELPSAIRLTAPPVHIPQSNEMAWRLQPDSCGAFEIAVVAGDARASRRVDACDSLQRLTPTVRLSAGGPVESLDIDYGERSLALAGHVFDWEAAFWVLVAIFALLLKPLTGAQF